MNGRGSRPVAIALTVALVVALAVLTGCGSGTQSSSTAAAAGRNAAIDQVVTALGTGKASAAPDRADLMFTVNLKDPTTKGAMAAAGKASDALVAALTAAGVSAEDIQTQNVSLNPQRDRRNAITGYAASVSLRVTTRDLSKAGDLLEAGTKAGATEVWGPSLYLSETNEARTRAIDSAVADAKVRAERMAKAAGRSVGAVVSITEQGAVSTYPNYLSKYAMAGVALDAGAPGIQPGQMDAYAHVSVSFELK